MIDESADIALLTAITSDLQSHMMIYEVHDEMEGSRWMACLRSAFYAWKELLLEPVGACHSWTRPSWLWTTKPAPSSSIPSRTVNL